MNIDAGTVKADSIVTPTSADVVPAGAAASVATADKGAGDATLTYADNGATLNLGATKTVAADTADLTWTATSGKTSAAIN
ncbi:hypothetical protein ACVPPR_00400 [Dellaglioa sp. L3N]